MNVSFDLYKIFYYVCEFKSVTKAASHLHVSQPAVTKHIKNLESILGLTLITKTSQGIQLTDDGEELHLKIKKSIESLIEVEPYFKLKEDDYDYVIKIVAGYSTIKKYLVPIISKFNKKHPNIRFEISTYNYHEAINRLRDGKADLIFLNLKRCEDKYNDLIIRKCYSVEDVFVVNNESEIFYPDVIKLCDLNEYPIICKSGRSVARKSIEEYFRKNNMIFKPKYELSNNWLIEEYVKLNLGIGLVTKEFIEKELSNGELIELKTDVSLPKREIGYAIRKNSLYYAILKEFIKELRNS